MNVYAPVSDGFGPNIPEYWNSRHFKIFLTKARQSDVTEFHGKSEIPNDFVMDFDICTVGLRSPISALQVGIVENVKFNHEFSLFFAQILLKNDTVYWRDFWDDSF